MMLSGYSTRVQGFSLVELMVAVLLGSLITVAAVQLFSTNQRTFILQQSLSEIQEQGRFSLDFISRDLRKAGFRTPGSSATAADVPSVVLGSLSVAGTVVAAGSLEGGAAATANDRLQIAFEGTVDCEGDVSAVMGTVVNSYQLNNQGELVCTGSIPPSGVATPEVVNTTANGVVLLSGVDSFQVLYGIDNNANEVPNVRRYVTADQVGGNPVLAIRVAILTRSNNPGVAEMSSDIRGFTVLDKTLNGGAAPLDEQSIRRLFVTTVQLRNFDPDLI